MTRNESGVDSALEEMRHGSLKIVAVEGADMSGLKDLE